MKINEIKRGISNISLQAKIIDISESREVNTKYGKKNVADALLEDETGQIGVSLWEDQISSVAVGDTIVINGGYVTEFREKLQLNVPRSGKLEVIKE
jgi:replication factor A1